MRKKRTTSVSLVLATLLMANSNISASHENDSVARLEGFPEAHLTIFPVTFAMTGPEEHRRFADGMMQRFRKIGPEITNTLGLLMEEQGYDKYVVADTEFRFPTEVAARSKRAANFGKFVSELDLKTDYALCTEFTLHLQKSYQEVYLVIVDTNGKVVWEDSQGPGDPEFNREFPGTPLKCCELASRRLTPVLGLDELPKKELTEERKEALRKLRAEQPPSPADFAAIEKRLEVMKKAGNSARVLIYPVRVDGDHTDQTRATSLSGLLNEAGLCKASLAQTGPVLEGAGWPNQMKVLWLFANGAKEYVRQHSVDNDYVLFADYWLRPRDKAVHAVHFVVCDRAGDWVIVDLQNSHQKNFQRIKPKNLADCDRLVLERLKSQLQ